MSEHQDSLDFHVELGADGNFVAACLGYPGIRGTGASIIGVLADLALMVARHDLESAKDPTQPAQDADWRSIWTQLDAALCELAKLAPEEHRERWGTVFELWAKLDEALTSERKEMTP